MLLQAHPVMQIIHVLLFMNADMSLLCCWAFVVCCSKYALKLNASPKVTLPVILYYSFSAVLTLEFV